MWVPGGKAGDLGFEPNGKPAGFPPNRKCGTHKRTHEVKDNAIGSDLAEVVAHWNELPANVQEAVLLLVRTGTASKARKR